MEEPVDSWIGRPQVSLGAEHESIMMASTGSKKDAKSSETFTLPLRHFQNKALDVPSPNFLVAVLEVFLSASYNTHSL